VQDCGGVSLRVWVICLGVLLLVAAPSPAATKQTLATPSFARIAARPATVPDASLRSAEAPAGFWGGVYTTRTNEHVTVYSSNTYAVDDTANERWAEFLASLVHGTELPSVSLYLPPPAEVETICGGEDILGCYGNDRIVAPGQGTTEVSAESVIAHEYGHHIAAHRLNAPWPALAWGTKRWASYEQVCKRARARELFPGAESPLLYLFNPGEVFAETYRLMNERKAGLPETPWRVVDPSLMPNDRDLALVERDVTQPWSANHGLQLRGTFPVGGKSVRNFKVATPLDGNFAASLQSVAGVRLDVLNGKKRVARGTTSAAGTVCGPRTLTFRVTRTSGSGSFALAVSLP
jgi:hypothetical protein